MPLDLIERAIFLRRTVIGRELPDPALRLIAEVAREVTFRAGTVIAYEEDIGQEMFLVVSGRIEVRKLGARPPGAERYPDLRPAPAGVGSHSLDGTRAATRTAIRYRNGVLNGRGASLLGGYMEDLATDRIYRLMIAQRMVHRDAVTIRDASGEAVAHTPERVSRLFDEELAGLIDSPTPGRDLGTHETMRITLLVQKGMVHSTNSSVCMPGVRT